MDSEREQVPQTDPLPVPYGIERVSGLQLLWRLRRPVLIAAVAVASLGVFAILFHRVQLVRAQKLCANYSVGPGTVSYEEEPVAAGSLLARPDYIRSAPPQSNPEIYGNPEQTAVFRPVEWHRFARLMGLHTDSPIAGEHNAIAFLGQLRRPDGEARIVVVEVFRRGSQARSTVANIHVVRPGTLLRAPVLTNTSQLKWTWMDLLPGKWRMFSTSRPVDVRIEFGRVDPNSPSRVNIRIFAHGLENTLSGELDNSDAVTFSASGYSEPSR